MLSAWLLVWVVAAAAVCLRAARRRAPRGASRSAGPTIARVLLARPCAGDEPWLERALESSARVARPGVSVRFAVASPEDAAVAVATRVAAGLVARGVDAGVDFTFSGAPNGKAGQLARVVEDEPRPDVVVVADSDVELEAASLEGLLAPLRADASVAASWAVPLETEPATPADRASAAVLDASLHSFALLSRLDRAGMVGKLFCVRASALEAVGGFASLASFLGEDMELARRLRAHGIGVVAARVSARSLVRGRSWRAVVDRYGRWIRVIRAQRRALLLSYPLLFAMTPLVVLGGLVAALRGDLLGWLVVALAVLERMAVAVVARRRSGVRFRPGMLIDALAADVLLSGALARALWGDRFSWRGRRLRHATGGTIEESAPGEPGQGAGRHREEEPRSLGVQRLEAVGGAGRDGGFDRLQLARDGLFERQCAGAHVVAHGDDLAEGHVDRRVGPAAHLVAKRTRHDGCAGGDARDGCRPTAEAERANRDGDLPPLREDPHQAARAVEAPRGVAHPTRAVGRVVEVDPECTHVPEERKRAQVLRIHHRVGPEPADTPAQVDDHQRVPPRRVVGHDEHRAGARRLVEPLDAPDEDPVEAPLDAALCVSGEPPAEPPASRRGDHGATPGVPA